MDDLEYIDLVEEVAKKWNSCANEYDDEDEYDEDEYNEDYDEDYDDEGESDSDLPVLPIDLENGTEFFLRRVKTDNAEYVGISESESYCFGGKWKVINIFAEDNDFAKDLCCIDAYTLSLIDRLEELYKQNGERLEIMVEVRDIYDYMMLSELIQKKLWSEVLKPRGICIIRVKYYTSDTDYTIGTY